MKGMKPGKGSAAGMKMGKPKGPPPMRGPSPMGTKAPMAGAMPFKKGGAVKRSEKAHMAEEMKALKKGGASKQLMAEERAEYAKKGYRKGGMVKPGMKKKCD